MDLETAEPASTRRSLLGVAGLAGAAAALVGASSASASSANPNRPTEADQSGLQAAIGLELAARDLYRAAADQLTGDDATLASVVAENHKAYAERISGTIGVAANTRDDVTFDSLVESFSTAVGADFARAARDLENLAVDTHTSLLAGYESIDAIEITASIITVESRHATVFTSMAGFAGNLDDMLGTGSAA